jgi:hypothetical protein
MRAVLVLTLTLSCAACGGSTTNLAGPTGTAARCQVTFDPPTVPAAGALLTTQLLATRDCVWAAEVDADWVALEPAAGQGEATIALTVKPNPTGRTRQGGVRFNDQRFSVMQEPAPCRYEVAPRTAAVPPSGARLLIQVTTLDGCAWTARSPEPWLRVISGSGGDASHAIEVGVDSNHGDDRSGQLTVAGLPVLVEQPRPTTSASRCEYSMDPGEWPPFPATGARSSVGMHVSPDCYWHAGSTEPWLVILSNSNGNGTARIEYRVEPNPSPFQRAAFIRVGTGEHVVRQLGLN